jgi:hypothetical protein
MYVVSMAYWLFPKSINLLFYWQKRFKFFCQRKGYSERHQTTKTIWPICN